MTAHPRFAKPIPAALAGLLWLVGCGGADRPLADTAARVEAGVEAGEAGVEARTEASATGVAATLVPGDDATRDVPAWL